MNQVRPDKDEEIVCYCSGTDQQQIKALIGQGVDNLERISRMTGACSGCGSCETLIVELLAEHSVL